MRVLALLLAMTSTAAAEAWVNAGAAIGGGDGRMGPVAGAAFVDGHYWVSPRIAVFATVLGFVASENEQEGRHVQGSMAGAGVTFGGVQRGRFALVPYYLSIGAGVGRMSGTDWTTGNDMAPFEDRDLAWTARAGVGYLFQRLHIGWQVVSYGFARGGFAIEPFSLIVGARW